MKMIIRKYHQVGFGLLFSILLFFWYLAYSTHTVTDLESVTPLRAYLITHHVWIMAVLVFISVGFGFFWAYVLYQQILAEHKNTKKILDIVLLFWGRDEKKVMDLLVRSGGEATQAEMARLEGMNAVRAFRSVQNMRDKKLVDVTSYGKVRKVRLKQNIVERLG